MQNLLQLTWHLIAPYEILSFEICFFFKQGKSFAFYIDIEGANNNRGRSQKEKNLLI